MIDDVASSRLKMYMMCIIMEYMGSMLFGLNLVGRKGWIVEGRINALTLPPLILIIAVQNLQVVQLVFQMSQRSLL